MKRKSSSAGFEINVFFQQQVQILVIIDFQKNNLFWIASSYLIVKKCCWDLDSSLNKQWPVSLFIIFRRTIVVVDLCFIFFKAINHGRHGETFFFLFSFAFFCFLLCCCCLILYQRKLMSNFCVMLSVSDYTWIFTWLDQRRENSGQIQCPRFVSLPL